jgi:hemerythrin-like domain-containing protein
MTEFFDGEYEQPGCQGFAYYFVRAAAHSVSVCSYGGPKTMAKQNAKKSSKSTSKKTSSRKAAPKAKSQSGKSQSALELLKSKLASIAEVVESYRPGKVVDIVGAIKEDHKGLRNFLDILKDVEKPITERRRAYKAFSELLKSHTTAEEEAVYERLPELTGRTLHVKMAEGFVEHQLAEDLMKRIERATDPLVWGAHCNVLSEIVEHHLKEEERDLLPLIRRKAPVEMNMDMLTQFLNIRAKTQKRASTKNAGALKT